MEHSYSKDFQPKDNVEVMATRSILIPRPPQCPSCHQHGNDDVLTKFDNQQNDPFFDQMPPAINDSIAKMAMEESERLTKNAKNLNIDEEDWELKINKFGWSKQQLGLFRQVANILDYDQLARLAIVGKPNEGVIRRCSVDKSVSRIRLALASVQWDVRLTQWLHNLLSDSLPPSYMASYLDLLQSLRAKVPTLVDKMIAGRPVSFNQDYLQAITKRPWGANVPTKQRKLPGQQPVIVIIPSSVYSPSQPPSSRLKRWFSLFSTMTTVVPIQHAPRQPSLEHVSEQLVAATRSKIQELRAEMPNRNIVLAGINTGAAIALQVALVETVSSIVCLGFAYNTLKGVRGSPDDRVLDITTPILFVLGENSARSSQEEIESLREKMSAQTSLVVVGSADDALRIKKFNRHMEGITQSMVDNMITDEVHDFVSTCIVNPPGPREVTSYLNRRVVGAVPHEKFIKQKKRKYKENHTNADGAPPRKVGRPRLNKTNEMPTGRFKPERPKPTSAMLKQSNEKLKMAIQSILPPPNDTPPANLMSTDDDVAITIPAEPTIISTSDLDGGQILSSFEVFSTESGSAAIQSDPSQSTLKMQSTNQFVQLKPPTTTARIQSPEVKNFFIRKGVEKRAQTHSYVTLRSGELQPTATGGSSQISPNKKIVIKSQQLIKPATGTSQQMLQALPGTIIGNSVATDLTDILDLPILFADSDGNLQDHAATEHGATTTQILSSGDPSQATTNILITSPDGKLPNRPVVISAANVSKINKQATQAAIASPGNSKLIFINRHQLKSTAAAAPTVTTVAKSMPPLKLVTSSSGQSGTTGTFTKLAPGTKIDLSTLKIVKSATPANSGNFVFNKAAHGAANSSRGTIVIKQSATSAGTSPHQVIKTGILNRNITVRKVVNLVPHPRASSKAANAPPAASGTPSSTSAQQPTNPDQSDAK